MAEPVAAGAAPTLTPPEGGAVAALPSGSPAPAAAGDAPRKTKHLEDFELGRVLGQGSFGAVVQAIDKETRKEVAMKIMEKNHILRQNKQKYVITERDILTLLDHPNIIKLYCTFRSESSLHYVFELCPNGELLSLIQKHKSFDEATTKFYVAEIVNALEHLHSKGIVHRDLKPENLLLDANWHLKLIDFGTAKNLKQTAEEASKEPEKPRVNSFVGTAEYVSPEILNAQVDLIGTSADLWALGCITYFMISGRYPFRGKSEMLTFQRITQRDLTFPPNFPPIIRDFVDKLCVLDPHKRLGAGPNGFTVRPPHPTTKTKVRRANRKQKNKKNKQQQTKQTNNLLHHHLRRN
eukprot:TRINITY_DN1279_c0_g1_i2.p1 TRINITY_DN1279_c0_g1~~TRINITY_DN1279_c0_g1_i2.p1  ORF type:complete len:362 (+),score=80.51 TRINITY_DN1279_c0_g1_i2:35-1087(+)